MESPRWFDRSLPQTLQIATLLLYMNAVLTILFPGAALMLLAGVAEAVGAFGIANAKRWGYILAVAGAIFPLAILLIDALAFGVSIFSLIFAEPLALIFEIALVALLLHPQSREYQKIWFH